MVNATNTTAAAFDITKSNHFSLSHHDKKITHQNLSKPLLDFVDVPGHGLLLVGVAPGRRPQGAGADRAGQLRPGHQGGGAQFEGVAGAETAVAAAIDRRRAARFAAQVAHFSLFGAIGRFDVVHSHSDKSTRITWQQQQADALAGGGCVGW
jgi:hypothetical protein